MSEQMNFLNLLNATSSQELADGQQRSGSQDGQTIDRSGPDHPHANLSASPAREKATPTKDTSPPNLQSWLGLPAPECCLANKSQARQCSEKLQSALNDRLQARLNGRGSMIYQIVSKQQVTPLGREIFRLRASAPRTSAKEGSSPQSGWNTPRATDGSNGGPNQAGGALSADAHLSGWPTPLQSDALKGGQVTPRKNAMALPETVQLAGWSTASARDWKDTGGMSTTGTNPDGTPRNRLDQLGRQVHLAGWQTASATDGVRGGAGITPGMTGQSLTQQVKASGPMRLTTRGKLLTGSLAGMESGGQLNPEHSRWLMGYPAVWGFCGAMAMQSYRKRPRNSSKQQRKR